METDYLFLVTPTMGGKSIAYKRLMDILLSASMFCDDGPTGGTIDKFVAHNQVVAGNRIIAHIKHKPYYIERIEVRD